MRLSTLIFLLSFVSTSACSDKSMDSCRDYRRTTLIQLQSIAGVSSADGLSRISFIKNAKLKYGELEDVYQRVVANNLTLDEKKEFLEVYGLFYLSSSLTQKRYDVFEQLIEYGISPFTSDEYFLAPIISILIDGDSSGFDAINRHYYSDEYKFLKLVSQSIDKCK